MSRFSLLLVAACLLICQSAKADPAEAFSSANAAFSGGEFEAAYSAYQSLLEDGHLSAPLLYNLGNTCYRLKQFGEAALWYERALTLDPGFKEARQNLRFLRRSSGSLQFVGRESPSLTAPFKRDTLIRLATAGGWLAALGFAAALTLRLGSGIRTSLWIASSLLTLLALLAAAGLFLKHRDRADLATQAIVVAKDAKAFTAPTRAAGKVIDLPPGSQVASLSKRGNWHYIDLPGDLRGWVPDEAVSPLWPYDSALAD